MLEIIKSIGVVLGCVSTLFALILTISKSARNWFGNAINKKINQKEKEKRFDDFCSEMRNYMAEDKDFKKKFSEDMEIQKEFAKDQLRNNIKDIFYKYCDIKIIPLYERKTADSAFKTYKDKFSGNSYISLLYEQICKWEIDYTHKFECE